MSKVQMNKVHFWESFQKHGIFNEEFIESQWSKIGESVVAYLNKDEFTDVIKKFNQRISKEEKDKLRHR
jgi:hypothetical protein